MNTGLWQQWNKNWEQMLSIATGRKWSVKPLLIKPIIDLWDVVALEETLGFQYPNEFKHILVNYSGGVHFSWSIKNEEPLFEFKDTFASGHYLWDFESLKQYDYWLTADNACLDKNDVMYDEAYLNKVPFLHVSNGDEIVFDVSKGLDNCPVVYLNHEDDLLHGAKLADNFIEFITIWSNIGGAGAECWQLEPFYDYSQQKLTNKGLVFDKWQQWLNQPA